MMNDLDIKQFMDNLDLKKWTDESPETVKSVQQNILDPVMLFLEIIKKDVSEEKEYEIKDVLKIIRLLMLGGYSELKLNYLTKDTGSWVSGDFLDEIHAVWAKGQESPKPNNLI
jgi:hypothetical protein